MQYIFEIIIPQCHHTSFFPQQLMMSLESYSAQWPAFHKGRVLILLWGTLSPGDDSEAPTEQGLPDLEMGEPCKDSQYKACTVESSPVAICLGPIHQPFTKTMLIPTYFQVKMVALFPN